MKVTSKIKVMGALGALGISLIGVPSFQGAVHKPIASPKMSLASSSGQVLYFQNGGQMIAIDPSTSQQIGSFSLPSGATRFFAAKDAPVVAYQDSSGNIYTANISLTGLTNITAVPFNNGGIAGPYLYDINSLGTELLIRTGSSGDLASYFNFYVVSIPGGNVVASRVQYLNSAMTPHFEAAYFDNSGNIIGESTFSNGDLEIATWNLSSNTIAPLAGGGTYSTPNPSSDPSGSAVIGVAPNSSDLAIVPQGTQSYESLITDSTASTVISTISGIIHNFEFSPNGQQIIFSMNSTQPYTIENIDGTGQVSLPSVTGDTLVGWTANYQVPVAPGGNGAPCTTVFPNGGVVAASNTPSGNGYYEVDSKGDVAAFGDATCYGSMAGTALNKPVVGMAVTPDGKGYYLVASDGGIFSFGDASFQGSTGAMTLNKPIVGMSIDQKTGGYWLVASDGGIFSFNAPFYGSTGNIVLNKPVVGMAPYNNGSGYWLVASDGGIFSFNAPFKGSMGGTPLNKPIVGMAPSANGDGYYLVAADGGIFTFNVPFYGSTGNIVLNKPIVAMSVLPGNVGYRFMASDGGVFDYNAGFYGSGAL